MPVVFDRFEFDVERRVLLDAGESVHLSPKAFRLLEVLIAAAPRALSKKELHDAIWPGTFVEESNIATLAGEVRTALGDDPRSPKFVRTVHGHGYAFIAELAEPAARTRAGTIVFRGLELPLYEGRNVLGRDPSADVQIDDVTVSRMHACINMSPSGATVEDLASKNGTFIDEQKLDAPTPLSEGTTIVLGDARLIYRRTGFAGSTVTLSHAVRES